MDTKGFLPELHPAQQGLKHEVDCGDFIENELPELHPAQQGLKPFNLR